MALLSRFRSLFSAPPPQQEPAADEYEAAFTMSSEEELKAKYIYGLTPHRSVTDGHATRRASTQCQYMLPTLLDMRAQKPALRILDVGCGPGSITIDLARLVPEARVVGLDLSAAVLETAKANASRQGVGNVEFVRGDVYALPFGAGAFDVVHTHQAVAHFHEHVAAVRELLRVTRPAGGVLCMREGDLQTARFYPDSPVLDECFAVIKRVHAANGGATDAGRRLKSWVVAAGVPRERITATHSAWSYNTPAQRREYGGHWPARCTQGMFAERAMEMGVTEEKLQEFARAWKRWVEDEEGLFAMMHGEVIVRV